MRPPVGTHPDKILVDKTCHAAAARARIRQNGLLE